MLHASQRREVRRHRSFLLRPAVYAAAVAAVAAAATTIAAAAHVAAAVDAALPAGGVCVEDRQGEAVRR